MVCCGTSKLDHDEPKTIADAIIKTGKFLQEELSADANVILTGLLLRDVNKSNQRNKTLKLNNYLKSSVKMKPTYIAWNKVRTTVHKEQSRDTSLYYKDYLHLIESRNNKFASNTNKIGLQKFPFITIIIWITHNHLEMIQEQRKALQRLLKVKERLLYNWLLT